MSQLTQKVSTLIPASWRERALTQECTVGILRLVTPTVGQSVWLLTQVSRGVQHVPRQDSGVSACGKESTWL
ncbi:hypothetical protein JOQ06_016466 [Pogonophryne albipinna]|uniref:Uncharacterized protein n=1 Tax=Pogonophryne albipinna TaxID=1090488 RepID=A0AAD6ABM6_9TELE|nr:hypothetical protein JOQ06_016466 [Pogonophryne albipinna]